ncbi:hypothetical protein AVEN_205816-1 [Araneus ventricosus]|uniref:Uncharacterized protein n=1 Tax=Araneus ventricosus TaxID=182803 RepID=A0A4Y2LVB2_ARAVE|nr:hypothetical protein AVEN_205816-1 [Araneus ventricosus]
MVLAILNNAQVLRTTPELAHPSQSTESAYTENLQKNWILNNPPSISKVEILLARASKCYECRVMEWAMYIWSFFSWQGHPRREGHSIIPSKSIKAMDKVGLLPSGAQGLVPAEAALSSFTMNPSPIVLDFLWASGLLDLV